VTTPITDGPPIRHLTAVGTLAARAEIQAAYRGFRITVHAARDAAGRVAISATLLGGPMGIVRRFAFRSDEHEALTACAACHGDLCSVVDDLLAGASARLARR
jgi:hypothetical protein